MSAEMKQTSSRGGVAESLWLAWRQTRTHLLIAMLPLGSMLLAACAAPLQTPIPTGVPTSTATPLPTPELEAVVVSALCTLMGRPAESYVKVGQPVVLRWGWNATTRELVQQHIDYTQTIVTLDGVPVEAELEGGILEDQTKGYYYATWLSNVGVLSGGTHTVTYDVSWTQPISDGNADFGPGTETESFSDECKIIVQ